ncbi:ATP-dependent RNA helicase SrmB [hydrothermal vent metagenome]|uniref:ATP-dependent RNA helicase SrmB n=1 Tax=hydrothermal vent metagenome TaxID=652676 RepID=A0A3B0WHI2_9ZZZZ
MFSSLLLDESLLAAIEQLGFSEMTEVQAAAIPQALEGKDLIVNARTGSGKTVAYVLPLLQQILDNSQSLPQAVILAPTRDLCRQINKQCTLLAQHTEITTAVIIGGEDPKYQIKALEKYPDIIIATPGRLLEHVKRNVVVLDAINILVLDEADRMLAMGFSDEVVNIANHCSEESQTILYSASFNQNKFAALIEAILLNPEIILIDSARENNENIAQLKVLADDTPHKIKLCQALLKNDTFSKAIVFANKKQTVNQISSALQAEDITNAYIHSDVEQDTRNHLLSDFRKDKINVLIATDVASRGLDVPDLDLIINFDVPKNGEDYMHRIGRTGRMFESGQSITLVNANEWNKMISIENFLKIECAERKIASLLAKFTGPENKKSSGKSFGKKRKKDKPEKNKSKTKNRVRDKKNIGKRRKPSENISD